MPKRVEIGAPNARLRQVALTLPPTYAGNRDHLYLNVYEKLTVHDTDQH